MGAGIKISAATQDVNKTFTEDLIMSSENKCLKVGEPKHTQVTTDEWSSFHGVVYTHSLGFVPVVILAIVMGGSVYFEPQNQNSPLLYVRAEVDETTITLNLTATKNTTYDIYYWLSETERAV